MFVAIIISINLLNTLALTNNYYMEIDKYFATGYTGSKNFSQLDVKSAKATGFTSPTDDYMERGIDLNEQLIGNKPATFFLRVRSDSMKNAGIFTGDVVIVDRSLDAVNGKIVIAVLDGEMLIRRFEKSKNKVLLHPESSGLSALEIDPGCDSFGIWGVVTYVIHHV